MRSRCNTAVSPGGTSSPPFGVCAKEPHGVRVERAQVLLRFNDEAVLVLLGELSRGADDLIDEPGQIDRLGIEFELTGFDLREVEYLVDEA
jgi:hypothetical protein